MILQCTINVLLLPLFFVLLMYFFNWLLNLFFNHHNPCYLNVNYRSCFRRASSNFRLCIWIRRILKIRIIFVLHVKQSVKNFSNFIFLRQLTFLFWTFKLKFMRVKTCGSFVTGLIIVAFYSVLLCHWSRERPHLSSLAVSRSFGRFTKEMEHPWGQITFSVSCICRMVGQGLISVFYHISFWMSRAPLSCNNTLQTLLKVHFTQSECLNLWRM